MNRARVHGSATPTRLDLNIKHNVEFKGPCVGSDPALAGLRFTTAIQVFWLSIIDRRFMFFFLSLDSKGFHSLSQLAEYFIHL